MATCTLYICVQLWDRQKSRRDIINICVIQGNCCWPLEFEAGPLVCFFSPIKSLAHAKFDLALNLLKGSGGGGRGSGLDNGMFHSKKDNTPNDKSKAHLIITFSGIVVHLGG